MTQLVIHCTKDFSYKNDIYLHKAYPPTIQYIEYYCYSSTSHISLLYVRTTPSDSYHPLPIQTSTNHFTSLKHTHLTHPTHPYKTLPSPPLPRRHINPIPSTPQSLHTRNDCCLNNQSLGSVGTAQPPPSTYHSS